ncbi:MAG: 16S rRNA (adenine(1518)-N(6)/adenine(1519)-N(6))-dimethyltransferase RsmA [Candidatus Anstonellales archaeon]
MKIKKSLGQSFLKNRSILEREANLAEIENKKVLEIGSGDGRLSEILLSRKPKKLFLVELDKELVELLKNKFEGKDNVEIISGDFLKLRPFKVDVIFGNIPYYISSKIIFRLLDWEFKEAVLMVQKEFGEKMVAKPGEKNYGRLSVTSQICFEVKKGFAISKENFFPKPKVDSIVMVLKKKRKLTEWEEKLIRELYAHKNKTVENALKKINAEIPESLRKKRPRHMTVEEVLRIKEMDEDCPVHKEDKDTLTAAQHAQKFRIQLSFDDSYELTVIKKSGQEGKLIQGAPTFVNPHKEDELLVKLGIDNRKFLFYWYYGYKQKEFPLIAFKEDGIYLYAVDSNLNVKRVDEKDFPAYLITNPKLPINPLSARKVGWLALTLGGETKERLESGKTPEPEKLLELPEEVRKEMHTNLDDKDKIKLVWDFIKQGGKLSLTYQEGLPPATANEFIERKAGDCTDFVSLTYAIGKELGLNIQVVSIRVGKNLDNGVLEPKGHSFCVINYSNGYYILDSAAGVFKFEEGSLEDVVYSHVNALFPGYHVLGDYYVSTEDNQIKGIYMAEFGGSYQNSEWLEQALEYGYTADYVYFGLAYFSYLAGEPITLSLAYLGKIGNKDELSLCLEGRLAFDSGDLNKAKEIGLALIKNYPGFFGGYDLLLAVYEKQENLKAMDEIKKTIIEKWPQRITK